MVKSGDIVRNIPKCFDRCKCFPALCDNFLLDLPVFPLHHTPIDQLVGMPSRKRESSLKTVPFVRSVCSIRGWLRLISPECTLRSSDIPIVFRTSFIPNFHTW